MFFLFVKLTWFLCADQINSDSCSPLPSHSATIFQGSSPLHDLKAPFSTQMRLIKDHSLISFQLHIHPVLSSTMSRLQQDSRVRGAALPHCSTPPWKETQMRSRGSGALLSPLPDSSIKNVVGWPKSY